MNCTCTLLTVCTCRLFQSGRCVAVTRALHRDEQQQHGGPSACRVTATHTTKNGRIGDDDRWDRDNVILPHIKTS